MRRGGNVTKVWGPQNSLKVLVFVTRSVSWSLCCGNRACGIPRGSTFGVGEGSFSCGVSEGSRTAERPIGSTAMSQSSSQAMDTDKPKFRDANKAPLRKLSVELINTYKHINEVPSWFRTYLSTPWRADSYKHLKKTTVRVFYLFVVLRCLLFLL